MCKLYDNILDKDKKGRLMVKKFFVIREEVIYAFHEKHYIPTIEKLSYHLVHVIILGSMEYFKTINDFFHANASKNNIKFKILCRKVQLNNR